LKLSPQSSNTQEAAVAPIILPSNKNLSRPWPSAPLPAYQASTTRSTAAPRFPPSAYLAAPIFCVAPQSPEIFHTPLKEYCRPVSKYLILAVNLAVIAVLNNPAGLFAYLPICGASRTAAPGFPLRSRACALK